MALAYAAMCGTYSRIKSGILWRIGIQMTQLARGRHKLMTTRDAPFSNSGTFCVVRPKSHNSFVYWSEKPKSLIVFQWWACLLNFAARSKAVNESLSASDRIGTALLVHHSLRQLLSVRSLIFASCTVCHCMLDGTSGPPHSSGTM